MPSNTPKPAEEQINDPQISKKPLKRRDLSESDSFKGVLADLGVARGCFSWLGDELEGMPSKTLKSAKEPLNDSLNQQKKHLNAQISAKAIRLKGSLLI